MKFRPLVAAAVALAASILPAAPAGAQSVDEVRQAVGRAIPNLPPSAQVVKTPYSGLFEVDVGNHLFYTDAKGSFLMSGELLDTRSGVNLTQQRMEVLERVSWKDLPMSNAFTVVFGNGKRQIAVFEDPYCPYCHQLEKTLEQIGNMTVHVFLFPVIRAESPAKSKEIWCAADRGRAWQAWMNEHKEPPKGNNCAGDPIQANLALGQRLGIQSTPTMFLESGVRITGAVSADDIIKAMARK